MEREMTDNSQPKGLAVRILGEQPTGLQRTVFWLMILSLTLWPICFFVSIFFFDAPIRTLVDEISRWGMVLTIWLYPLYLLPLMALNEIVVPIVKMSAGNLAFLSMPSDTYYYILLVCGISLKRICSKET